MKREFIIGLLFCVISLSFNNDGKTEEKPLTNAKKIARDLQKALGTFNGVYYYNDSLAIMYTYRPEANKTQTVKGVIDKTLNMAGKEVIPKNFLDPEYSYGWETATETISMRGVYGDSSSYVNVWIYAK